MKIYVASSWRNARQQEVVEALRKAGHEVYDFKNPENGSGFAWSSIDSNWHRWTTSQYVKALNHPIATAGFASDFDAMAWADVCVIVLPCGRSAHTEAGFMAGEQKPVFVLTDDSQEPELMYKIYTLITNKVDDIIGYLGGIATYRCLKNTYGFTAGRTYVDKGDGWFIDDHGGSHGVVPSILTKYFEKVK